MYFTLGSSVSIVNYEHVIADWYLKTKNNNEWKKKINGFFAFFHWEITLMSLIKKTSRIIGSFWKLVKLMFSNKFINEQNITFVENQNILTKEVDTTKALNDFYIFVVFNKKWPVIKNASDYTLEAILNLYLLILR